MKKISATLFLLLACALCSEVQGQRSRWASARERRLKGPVRSVLERCSSGGDFKTAYKYEFDRGGKLTAITSFQPERPAVTVGDPRTHKITRRDGRGWPAEVSFFEGGELESRERYEVEYDDAGNWTRLVTYVMRDYEVVGSGTARKWLVASSCDRTIEYHR